MGKLEGRRRGRGKGRGRRKWREEGEGEGEGGEGKGKGKGAGEGEKKGKGKEEKRCETELAYIFFSVFKTYSSSHLWPVYLKCTYFYENNHILFAQNIKNKLACFRRKIFQLTF